MSPKIQRLWTDLSVPASVPASGLRGEANFGTELSAAIAKRGSSLHALRAHLIARGSHVSIATLSYWRSGRSQPERRESLKALAHLEEILGLGEGELFRHLGPSRRSERRDLFLELPRQMPEGASTRALLLSMNSDSIRMGMESIHATHMIDESRQERRVVVRRVIRGLEDSADEILVVHAVEQPVLRPATFNVAGGVKVVNQSVGADGMTFGAVLKLPRALRRGELSVVDYVFEPPEAGTSYIAQWGLPGGLREFVCEAQFHRNSQPSRCEGFVAGRTDEEIHELRVAGNGVQFVVQDVGRVRAGIRWAW